MIPSTIARSSSDSAKPLTNDRSILSATRAIAPLAQQMLPSTSTSSTASRP
jgi:hypothetical protein